MSNLHNTVRDRGDSGGSRRGIVVLLSMLLLVLAGCTDDAEGGATAESSVELPGWLETVSPVPGAEAAPTDIIEVQHTMTGEFEGVRILIDGTDVTADALPNEGTQGVGAGDADDQNPVGEDDANTAEGEGLLAYDPNTEVAPVQIDPGAHTVTLQQVRQPEEGEGDLEVLDTFEYTFTVR
jgi:hypothetical protein